MQVVLLLLARDFSLVVPCHVLVPVVGEYLQLATMMVPSRPVICQSEILHLLLLAGYGALSCSHAPLGF